MVRLLLAKGADCSILDRQNKTALERACQTLKSHDDYSIACLLLEECGIHGDDFWHFLEEIPMNSQNQKHLLRLFLEGGFNFYSDSTSTAHQAFLLDRKNWFHTVDNWRSNDFDTHIGELICKKQQQVTGCIDTFSCGDDNTLVCCNECTEERVVYFCEQYRFRFDRDALMNYGLCWMRHFMLFNFSTHCLKSICRLAIRRCIGHINMAAKIRTLSIPRPLQEYLLLREMLFCPPQKL